MKNSIKILLTCSIAVSVMGCEKHWSEQMRDEIRGGTVADFSDGLLDGYSTFGYDASYLRESILRHLERKRDIHLRMPLDDFAQGEVGIYFGALKFADDSYLGIKPREKPSFRFQYGWIKRYSRGKDTEHVHDPRRWITVFMKTGDDEVHVLSFNCFRNLSRSHSLLGRDFKYGTSDVKLGIWDAHLPDRNRPEQVLTNEYKEVFAVATMRPLNYLPYAKAKRFNDAKFITDGTLMSLRWRTPECLFFVPVVLGKKKNDTDAESGNSDADRETLNIIRELEERMLLRNSD